MASILLIDDDCDLRELMDDVLRLAGHAVETAGDGKTGLALYTAGRHDLIITDIVMPDMDGLELIDGLRQSQQRPRVIAMSGGSTLSVSLYLSTARQLGAQRILAKPIENRALLQTVNEILLAAAPAPIIRLPAVG